MFNGKIHDFYGHFQYSSKLLVITRGYIRCSPVFSGEHIAGGVATGQQTRDGRGAGAVTDPELRDPMGINQCFVWGFTP